MSYLLYLPSFNVPQSVLKFTPLCSAVLINIQIVLIAKGMNVPQLLSPALAWAALNVFINS